MRIARVCLFMMTALLLTTTVRAQAPVTAADLSRLDSAVAEIDRQVVALKKTDPTLAADVDRSLTDLRDEVAVVERALAVLLLPEQPLERVVLVGDEAVEARRRVVLRQAHAGSLPWVAPIASSSDSVDGTK